MSPSGQDLSCSQIVWQVVHNAQCNWYTAIDWIRLNWIKLILVSVTARRSNQHILKEISPEYSLEGLMLKLKLQYFGHLMHKANSLEKFPWCSEILRAGGERGNRGWDGWMASLTPWTWVWASSRSWWWTGTPGMLQSMGSKGSVQSSHSVMFDSVIP